MRETLGFQRRIRTDKCIDAQNVLWRLASFGGDVPPEPKRRSDQAALPRTIQKLRRDLSAGRRAPTGEMSRSPPGCRSPDEARRDPCVFPAQAGSAILAPPESGRIPEVTDRCSNSHLLLGQLHSNPNQTGNQQRNCLKRPSQREQLGADVHPAKRPGAHRAPDAPLCKALNQGEADLVSAL